MRGNTKSNQWDPAYGGRYRTEHQNRHCSGPARRTHRHSIALNATTHTERERERDIKKGPALHMVSLQMHCILWVAKVEASRRVQRYVLYAGPGRFQMLQLANNMRSRSKFLQSAQRPPDCLLHIFVFVCNKAQALAWWQYTRRIDGSTDHRRKQKGQNQIRILIIIFFTYQT